MLPVIRKKNYYPAYTNGLFGNDLLSGFFSDGADYTTPAVNIKENEKAFELEIAAPGLSKNDFEVKIEKDLLVVSSKNETKEEKSQDNFTRKEFSYKAFRRSFSLPESVETEKIDASHKNGVLYISLPKMEEAKLNKSKVIKIS